MKKLRHCHSMYKKIEKAYDTKLGLHVNCSRHMWVLKLGAVHLLGRESWDA